MRILMFPWLAHGHIFPFLELAKRILARKNFYIYLCSTLVNFPSIKNFIQTHNLEDSIEVVELHLEPSSELPPHYHTTKNLPSHLNLTLVKAFQTTKSSFTDIVTRLNPDLVIYDFFQPWAARHALSQGIQSVYFSIVGAASRTYSHNQYCCRDDNFPFPELSVKGYERKSWDVAVEFFRKYVFIEDEDDWHVNYRLSSEVTLHKTSREFEAKYIDYLSSVCNKKALPVGPLVTISSDGDDDSEVLQWLNKKAPHSTVYISFGSEHFLSKEEIEEIAKGVRLCEVNFIWVIRFPHGESRITLEEVLPRGFLDKVQDRGVVITGWAPQTKILKHPNIGAFISHCGWSSVMESIYFGVPIIGMPSKHFMFVDANFLVDSGVCVRIALKESEVYKGEDIGKVIREVIVGKSGDGLRRRAREISEKMRMEEEQELDVVADQLWHLCLKTTKSRV